MDFFIIPRQRHDLYSDFRFSTGSAAALGDGIHIPALVGNLGEEVVFPFPD